MTTESGLQLVLERTRAEIANANGERPTVTPASTGGPIMGPWGSNVALPATSPWDGWPISWGTSWNGVGLNQRVGVAMTCTDLTGRILATMPTYVTRGEDIVTSPPWTTNPEPTVYASWEEAMKQAVNSLLLRGEAFIYCTGRYASPNGITPGQVARWAVLNPDATSIQNVDGTLVYRLNGSFIGSRDTDQPVSSSEVLHVKFQSWPGYVHGLGPLEWTAANAIGAQALEAYVANLASRGGVPWAILHSKRNLNGDQSRDLQNAWVAASASRNGAPAVLTGDLELEVMQISPKDMALLDLRVFDEQRIAAAFGVPAFLVGLPMADGLVYSNATALFDFFWRATLRPFAQTIASALSAWALPLGQTLEFDPDKFTQPPLAERAATYATLFNIYDPATGKRAIEIDEIRARERWAPSSAETQMEVTTV